MESRRLFSGPTDVHSRRGGIRNVNRVSSGAEVASIVPETPVEIIQATRNKNNIPHLSPIRRE
jgi:hypothetical protein